MPVAETETETDLGPHDRGAGPERLCVSTRTVKPTREILRFVLDPAGAVVPDLKRRLPGRGVWVTATREAVVAAVRRNAFARGFKRQVRVSLDLAAETERLLEKSVLDALSITYKAGLVEVGFARTEAVLKEGRVLALIRAAEASADGARKLAAAVRRADGKEVRVPVLTFTGAQLDLALGRSNVIHAALLAGPASEALLARYGALERFRGSEPANAPERADKGSADLGLGP
jgi:uncharacterized protein